jgi:GT2 family glycosyltransferase/tetratricopeptide (TPR) repeat protein/2-polyprenyl-3-methyl-5-hydroxy-6-metoxy-1,4-benzoquinol methylase
VKIQRVALIFNNAPRPETTGFYCRRALGRLVEVEHFLPEECGRIPRNGFDLYLQIDDGLPFCLPEDLRPSAFWAIDTHVDFGRGLRQSERVDCVFAAQRDGAEELRRHGIATAAWLPLACDPEIHCPHDVANEFDVCFVGNVFPGPREEVLDILRGKYARTFIGRRYLDAMARVYSASKIVFNRSLRNDLNMRVFEALACGSLLVTNDLAENGQAGMFQDGVHLATYRDAEELLEKIGYYLAHENERELIAAAGRRLAVERHSYACRMQTLLAAVERHCSSSAVSVEQALEDRTRDEPALALTLSQKGRGPEAPHHASRQSLEGSAFPGGAWERAKDTSYFEFSRPDVLALVPQSARRVLDIGCGAGRLGESIKARQPAHVAGVEMSPDAAERAGQRLDRVDIGTIEDAAIDFPEQSFDCVICADVLEHLRSPEAVLLKIRRWLAPDGTLVASIPNVANQAVIRSLLEGNWTYESAGLLDQDHVRFFTRREIEKMLFRAGFEVRELRVVPGNGFSEWESEGRRREVKLGQLRVQLPSAERAIELFAYQYLTAAVPRVRESDPLTSIVIVTHNQLSYTRLCIDSIRLRTDVPYELIFVDNGSTDGTVDYLRSIAGAPVVPSAASAPSGAPDVRIVANSENRGFPTAANQVIREARGENILLLNNDTIVTTGWLRRLLDALHRSPDVGLVGPCSNQVSGVQQVAAEYDQLESLDGFAWDWGKQHSGQHVSTDRLVGFCLLVRREVIERVGLLDEQFGIGNFEDDDFCRRAIAAGFRAEIAVDAFVHHFGHATFQGTGVDVAALMAENQSKYEAKWNDGGQSALVNGANAQLKLQSPPEAEHVEPGGVRNPQTANPKPPRLSLCMIVRDNETTIGPCLASIRPWVDEIVIVDTGSKDRTPEICSEYASIIHHLQWCDDFSAARNESLKHARGEWIFWMDSDDTISADCGRKLRALADGPHAENVLGYVMQVHCPGAGEAGEQDVTIVDHVKLFRNRSDLRFEGRIHEQLLPAIRRAGGDVAWTDIYVVHSGTDHSPEASERKLERDLRILKIELAERPRHPFVLFNLGMTYADSRQHDEAIDCLAQCIAVSTPDESHLRKAYALLVSALSQAGRHDEARQRCQEGRAMYPDDKELLFRSAMLHHHFGRLPDAEQMYLAVLTGTEERHFTSIDRQLAGTKARHNLAIVYEDMGRFERAADQWRAILAEDAEYLPAWRGLAEALFRRDDDGGVWKLLNQMDDQPGLCLRPTRQAIKSRLLARAGDVAGARRTLESALDEAPQSAELLQGLSRLLFETATPEEAESALRRLTSLAPGDAAAWYNLGTICCQLSRYDEAVDAYQQSLTLRPDSEMTQRQLESALTRSEKRGGKTRAAV